MGCAEVEAFLTHLALAGQVAASTQNQAKSALLFLYKEVLQLIFLGGQYHPGQGAATASGSAHRERGEACARPVGGHALADGEPALWRWAAAFRFGSGVSAQLVVIAQEVVSVEQPALLADFFGQQFEEP
jgi:hypothetical protein